MIMGVLGKLLLRYGNKFIEIKFGPTVVKVCIYDNQAFLAEQHIQHLSKECCNPGK